MRDRQCASQGSATVADGTATVACPCWSAIVFHQPGGRSHWASARPDDLSERVVADYRPGFVPAPCRWLPGGR
jgi:hypothetical protein